MATRPPSPAEGAGPGAARQVRLDAGSASAGGVAALALPPDAVHVWRIDPAATAPAAELLPALEAEERQRADRFHFARDRDRFIVTRGMLRRILARYLIAAPEAVRFRYGSHGKPTLAPDQNGTDLRFNLSHTEGLALLAVARAREVGIDVERVRPGFASEEIAERFFAPAEVRALRALPRDRQDDAFFACWTRKEAYVKARGEGLSIPLDQFTVSLAPDEPAALLRVATDAAETARWSLHDLAVGPDYRAALLVEGSGARISWWAPER